MPEQTVTPPTANKAEIGIRSHLLLPVMESNRLEDKDISHFLGGRLSNDGEDSDPPAGARLS